MKNFKSILCLILALVMVMALAACGEKQAEESKPQESKPAESKPVEGENNNDDPYAEAVTLKWFLNAPNVAQGQEEVDKELKRIVKEAINVDLETRWIPASDFYTQVGTLVTAGDWDIGTVNGAIFNANVQRNAFLDLTPYLEAGALPTASAEIPEAALQAGMYDGKVYAITPTKDIGSVYNNIINREMMEKIGIPIPEDRPTRRSLYGWMEEVNAKFREDPANEKAHPLFGINTNMFNNYFFDSIIGGHSAMGALVATNVVGLEEYGCGDKTNTTSVYCTAFTPEFEEWIYERYDQTASGVAYGYPAQDSDPKWFNNGDMMMSGNQGLMSIDENTYMDSGNFHVDLYNCTEGLIYTGYLHAGMYAINANCENPDRAIALMELRYNHEEMRNLLAFGIEGKDWEDADNDGVVEILERNSDSKNRYWYQWYPCWNVGVLQGKVAPGSDPKFIELMREQNNTMTVSQNVGFVVDQANIQNEVAALTNVCQEYKDRWMYPITIGSRDAIAGVIKEFQDKLNANGLQKVLDEVQAQLDAFNAGK